MALTLNDARVSLREAIFYFHQLEDTNETEFHQPFSFLDTLPLVDSSDPKVWTTQEDVQLLQKLQMMDQAIDAAIKQIKSMKWELFARATHFGTTSYDLEIAYQRRFNKLKNGGEDLSISLLSTTPEPSLSFVKSEHESTQSLSKSHGFRYPPSPALGYESKKRSRVSSGFLSPYKKRLKTELKQDPENLAQARDIDTIPAYSPPTMPTAFSSSAALSSSLHRSSEERLSRHMGSYINARPYSLPELRAEVSSLGPYAEETFEEFVQDQEKLAKSKVKALKFSSRFPSQATRIGRYTHFDLQHHVKKAGLSKYSALNKPEMLDKYLAYLYDKYKNLTARDIDQELSRNDRLESTTNGGW